MLAQDIRVPATWEGELVVKKEVGWTDGCGRMGEAAAVRAKDVRSGAGSVSVRVWGLAEEMTGEG